MSSEEKPKITIDLVTVPEDDIDKAVVEFIDPIRHTPPAVRSISSGKDDLRSQPADLAIERKGIQVEILKLEVRLKRPIGDYVSYGTEMLRIILEQLKKAEEFVGHPPSLIMTSSGPLGADILSSSSGKDLGTMAEYDVSTHRSIRMVYIKKLSYLDELHNKLGWGEPTIREGTPEAIIDERIERAEIEMSVKEHATDYRVFIIVGFMVVEIIGIKVFKSSRFKGLTKTGLSAMDLYDKFLVRISRRKGGKEGYSPEFMLLLSILMVTMIHIASGWLTSSTGSIFDVAAIAQTASGKETGGSKDSSMASKIATKLIEGVEKHGFTSGAIMSTVKDIPIVGSLFGGGYSRGDDSDSDDDDSDDDEIMVYDVSDETTTMMGHEEDFKSTLSD